MSGVASEDTSLLGTIAGAIEAGVTGFYAAPWELLSPVQGTKLSTINSERAKEILVIENLIEQALRDRLGGVADSCQLTIVRDRHTAVDFNQNLYVININPYCYFVPTKWVSPIPIEYSGAYRYGLEFYCRNQLHGLGQAAIDIVKGKSPTIDSMILNDICVQEIDWLKSQFSN